MISSVIVIGSGSSLVGNPVVQMPVQISFPQAVQYVGLKSVVVIYSVPERAVPPFRVPPYRGGTAERFGRFCRVFRRNGAERCGTAERLSYPQATRFPKHSRRR